MNIVLTFLTKSRPKKLYISLTTLQSQYFSRCLSFAGGEEMKDSVFKAWIMSTLEASSNSALRGSGLIKDQKDLVALRLSPDLLR